MFLHEKKRLLDSNIYQMNSGGLNLSSDHQDQVLVSVNMHYWSQPSQHVFGSCLFTPLAQEWDLCHRGGLPNWLHFKYGPSVPKTILLLPNPYSFHPLVSLISPVYLIHTVFPSYWNQRVHFHQQGLRVVFQGMANMWLTDAPKHVLPSWNSFSSYGTEPCGSSLYFSWLHSTIV